MRQPQKVVKLIGKYEAESGFIFFCCASKVSAQAEPNCENDKSGLNRGSEKSLANKITCNKSKLQSN